MSEVVKSFLNSESMLVRDVTHCNYIQDECWFRPKNSMMFQMEGSLYSSASKVLKERVRTLEQTADVMARASFLKGNRKFVIRQPDYEFFLSRRR